MTNLHELEQSVLGCILIDSACLMDVAEIVKPGDFAAEAHQMIAATLYRMAQVGTPIDTLTLLTELGGSADEVGGLPYLMELTTITPTANNATEYAKAVKSASTRRRVDALGLKIRTLAHSDATTDDVLSAAQDGLWAISQDGDAGGYEAFGMVAMETFQRDMETWSDAGAGGLTTGLFDLDEALAGMQAGELIIFASRPGIGKSTLALQIGAYNAKKGKKVGYNTLEMRPAEFARRLTLSEADVNQKLYRLRKSSEGDKDSALKAMNQLFDLSLWLDGTPDVTPMQMHNRARIMRAKHGLDLLIVDYLQLVKPDTPTRQREQDVASISRAMKLLARKLDVPVIVLAQLNRAADQDEGAAPKLHHLRESGAIEADADMVLFLHRPNEDKKATNHPTTFTLAKHRSGNLCQAHMILQGDRYRFVMERKGGQDEPF